MLTETESAAPVLPASRPASVREVLVQFVVNPYRSIILRWNGKSAGRDYRLFIVGQGMSRAAVGTICERQAPGRVRFLGHIGGRAGLP